MYTLGGRPDIPSTWDPLPVGIIVLCSDLQPGCPEYQVVLGSFEKTMIRGGNYTEIIKIQRVQNPGLYSLYNQKKESMGSAIYQNERQLFHGSDSENALKINANGFNQSYAGSHGKNHLLVHLQLLKILLIPCTSLNRYGIWSGYLLYTRCFLLCKLYLLKARQPWTQAHVLC